MNLRKIIKQIINEELIQEIVFDKHFQSNGVITKKTSTQTIYTFSTQSNQKYNVEFENKQLLLNDSSFYNNFSSYATKTTFGIIYKVVEVSFKTENNNSVERYNEITHLNEFIEVLKNIFNILITFSNNTKIKIFQVKSEDEKRLKIYYQQFKDNLLNEFFVYPENELDSNDTFFLCVKK